MCAALFEQSAQCNQHMTNYDKMSMYMTQQEIDLESRYCSFIDNIVYGAYDETGEIMLKRESFEIEDCETPSNTRSSRSLLDKPLVLPSVFFLLWSFSLPQSLLTDLSRGNRLLGGQSKVLWTPTISPGKTLVLSWDALAVALEPPPLSKMGFVSIVLG